MANSPTIRIFAYRSGELSFIEGPIGKEIINGALLVASGPSDVVGPIVRGMARLAWDNETYLVPGCPEAPNDSAAFEAFMTWWNLVQKSLGKHALTKRPK